MLFKLENVRAIFNGRKTQTRRIKLPHNLKRHLDKHGWELAMPSPTLWWASHVYKANRILTQHPYSECVCPGRGKPAAMWRNGSLMLYDNTVGHTGAAWKAYNMDHGDWQPLRITYTGLHYERLQDITEEDVRAEGCELRSWGDGYDWPKTAAFAELWDSINNRPGVRWADNPYVWVISFVSNNRGES